MSRAFTELAFTPSVKAAQVQYGSRDANKRLESAATRHDRLTDTEKDFIQARDGFYQATISQSGWPYVQFRGGAVGFLKVIDDVTIGYADFRGNRQYLSVGNMAADDRVSLIFMDYANRRRLKIWGRARVAHSVDEPELLDSLALPRYAAVVERAIVIKVEAFDWNCPQHITPRYTEAEVQAAIAPLLAELAELRSRLDVE